MKKPIVNTLSYDIPVVINNETIVSKEFVPHETLNKLLEKLTPPRYYISTIIPKATQPIDRLEPEFIYIVDEERLAQIKQDSQPGITLGIQLWIPNHPITNSKGFLGYENFAVIWV